MTTISAPICFECKYLSRTRGGNSDTSSGVFSCSAYPDGIPDEILLSEVNHREPYKGDHGIQYEPETSQQPR